MAVCNFDDMVANDKEVSRQTGATIREHPASRGEDEVLRVRYWTIERGAGGLDVASPTKLLGERCYIDVADRAKRSFDPIIGQLTKQYREPDAANRSREFYDSIEIGCAHPQTLHSSGRHGDPGQPRLVLDH